MASITFQKDGVGVVNQTITPADFVNGVWHSDEVTVTNDTRVTANVSYASLTPDGADVPVDYRLQAVLEGQEDTGEWIPLVRQFTPTFRSENAPLRRLIANDGPTAYDPDFGHIIPNELGNESVEVSVSDVAIPDKIRMCLVLGDTNTSPPNAGLTSVVVTMTGNVR